MVYAVLTVKVACIYTKYMPAKLSLKDATQSNMAIQLLDSHMQNKISTLYQEFQSVIKECCRQDPNLRVSPALFVAV